MDTFEHNRRAWDKLVRDGNRWTVGVSPEEVAGARSGELNVLLTPKKWVPADWIGPLGGSDVLCLASGGGQQGPLFAAAGATVTVYDASDAQLQRDVEVAAREALELKVVQGDMRDLGCFLDESFDLVFHPCSNCFVEDVRTVWSEAYRVLRPGGHLLAGFNNPVAYCFDWTTVEAGDPRIKHRLPYRDIDHPDDPYVRGMLESTEPLEFSHTLSDQLAGQLEAGFMLVGLYEDSWGDRAFPDPYFDGFIATRALRPLV